MDIEIQDDGTDKTRLFDGGGRLLKLRRRGYGVGAAFELVASSPTTGRGGPRPLCEALVASATVALESRGLRRRLLEHLGKAPALDAEVEHLSRGKFRTGAAFAASQRRFKDAAAPSRPWASPTGPACASRSTRKRE